MRLGRCIPPDTAATLLEDLATRKKLRKRTLRKRDGERSVSLPLSGIVPKDQPGAGPLHLAVALDHLAHRVIAEGKRRQNHLFKHLAHIARVRRHYEFAAVGAHAQRLMTSGMAVCRYANDAAIAEQIVLAID